MTDGPISQPISQGIAQPIAGTRARKTGRSHWLIAAIIVVAALALVGWLLSFYKGADADHIAAVTQMRQLIATQDKTVQADGAAYEAELTKLGLKQAMQPQNLTTRAGVETAKAKLAQAETIVARYRTQEDVRVTETRDKLYNSKMNLDDKTRYLGEFDNTENQMTPMRLQMWDLQEAEIKEASASVDVLARTHGAWRMVGGKVMFVFPADLNNFAMHQQTLTMLHAQEQNLNAQMRYRAEHPTATTDMLQN